MSKLSASEEKMLMLQHHMRENNMDLEAFVKDMNKWEDDIKEKEQKLKSEKAVNGKVCWWYFTLKNLKWSGCYRLEQNIQIVGCENCKNLLIPTYQKYPKFVWFWMFEKFMKWTMIFVLNFVAGLAPCKKQFENKKEEESENSKGRWQSGEEATETD